MKFDFIFRQIDNSTALTQYTEDKLTHACRYLLKDGQVSVHYYLGKKDYSVEVMVSNPDGHFKAKSSGKDFYSAIDEVAEKLEKQFLKKRQKLKQHKNYEKSKQGRFEHLNDMLEYEYGEDYYRKAS
jgi:putative sigma-54 modulation protein